MPRVKTFFVKAHHDTVESWRKGLKIQISVDVKGKFYCVLPTDMLLPLKNVFDRKQLDENKVKGTVKVFADTLDALEDGLQSAYHKFTTPTVKKEPVIRYNIESHVSFAADKDGNIYPNNRYEGAEQIDRAIYGGHHAGEPAYGGYSLRVGAMAMLKITHSYGDQDKVKYEYYYKDGFHLNHDNPAERLNSWNCLSLPADCKEIPYSDEAAEFFYNLMHGMAKLAQLVMSHTFEQEKLLAMIYSGNLLRIGAAGGKELK